MKKVFLVIGVFGILAAAALVTNITLYFLNGEKEVFDFDEDFLFGAATSAYQIEGGWNEGGKSPSIWDTLTHDFPNMITDRSSGDVAADSYHLFRDDVRAMKAVGLKFYRFSISWSRILPNGAATNEAGISYYVSLINELIANDIEPMITIYHWDLPQYLQDIGGWTNPLIVDYFEHYADVLFERLGNNTKKWITFNEPYIFCQYGYGDGNHAPMVHQPGIGEYLCGHHVLLAHAKVYHLYKEKYAEEHNGQIGICLYSAYFYPYEGERVELADQALNHMLGWFANPIFSANGNYPQIMMDNINRNSEAENRPWSRFPKFTEAEIASLKGSSDFLALNYYTTRLVQTRTEFPEEKGWEDDAGIVQRVDPNWHRGKSGFLYSVPQGLQDLLIWIKNSYNNPLLMITENGYSDDGQLVDNDRIKYLKDHLNAIKNAISEGCNIKAYTVWSLIDNFEWLAGYSEKFGIYAINATVGKERIAKRSSVYYREMIRTRKIKVDLF